MIAGLDPVKSARRQPSSAFRAEPSPARPAAPDAAGPGALIAGFGKVAPGQRKHHARQRAQQPVGKMAWGKAMFAKQSTKACPVFGGALDASGIVGRHHLIVMNDEMGMVAKRGAACDGAQQKIGFLPALEGRGRPNAQPLIEASQCFDQRAAQENAVGIAAGKVVAPGDGAGLLSRRADGGQAIGIQRAARGDAERRIGLENGAGKRQRIGPVPAIVVGKGDQGLACRGNARVARPRKAAWRTDVANGKAVLMGADQRHKPVILVLIDENNFEMRKILSGQRAEKPRQMVGAIDAANNQAEHGAPLPFPLHGQTGISHGRYGSVKAADISIAKA